MKISFRQLNFAIDRTPLKLHNLISFVTITCSIFLIGCQAESPRLSPTLTLPSSQIRLWSAGETILDLSYSACEKNPSPSEMIDDYPPLLFSPGIFLSDGIGRMENDIGFYFIFHHIEGAFLGLPTNDEFWDYLQRGSYAFNEAPYKRDFFLKVTKAGKVYQNWWNGDLMAGAGQSISQDETGLKFSNPEFSSFDSFEDNCQHSYRAIRLQGNIEGYLITENRADTLQVDGNLDVFLHISEN